MKKTNKIIYWISTLWLSLGMVSTGLVQLFRQNEQADYITDLGFPEFSLTLLSIWKILGVIVLLIPKFTLLKEWAYAGFFFAMSGAVYSHIVAGDPVNEIFPSLLLLILTLISWYFRPTNRKIIPVSQ